MPVVNEVPVIGNAVFCTVLGHRRNDHAVGKFEASQLEGQEHRRSGAVSALASRKPSFVAVDKLWVPNLQVLVSDALAAGQKTVGELLRRQMYIACNVLKPLHAIARRALEAKNLYVALFMICTKRSVEIIGSGDVLDQRDGVLHRELCPRSNREVRSVGRVPNQHYPAVVPFLA